MIVGFLVFFFVCVRRGGRRDKTKPVPVGAVRICDCGFWSCITTNSN